MIVGLEILRWHSVLVKCCHSSTLARRPRVRFSIGRHSTPRRSVLVNRSIIRCETTTSPAIVCAMSTPFGFGNRARTKGPIRPAPAPHNGQPELSLYSLPHCSPAGSNTLRILSLSRGARWISPSSYERLMSHPKNNPSLPCDLARSAVSTSRMTSNNLVPGSASTFRTRVADRHTVQWK